MTRPDFPPDLKIHPAADLLPLMSDEEFNELVEDIREHGQREPVVFCDGQLLDGRNRYLACKSLGIRPLDSELAEGVDPFAYVISLNLHRRQLRESQRGMVAGRLKKHFEAEAQERMSAGGGDKKSGVANLPHPIEGTGKSRDKAAAALNVSGRTVQHAETVLEKGTPELIAAVESGKVKVSGGVCFIGQHSQCGHDH